MRIRIEVWSNHKNGLFLIRATVAIALVAGAIGAAEVRAQRTQAGDAPLPSFEVASIKVNKSALPSGGRHLFGGRFNATGSAMVLIEAAYGDNGNPLSPDQVSGGPDWIKSEVFDIDAKVDDSVIQGGWKKLSFDEQWNQVMLMLRSLLADRFKLTAKHATKELPVYALVVAKNGPKLVQDNTHPWGIRSLGPGKIEATSADISQFTFSLSLRPELARRVVLDKTGLQSHYSFTLQWTPENLGARDSQAADSTSSPDSLKPSLFTALQEQLGLRLESTKAPVDTIVIEHIEQPSEN